MSRSTVQAVTGVMEGYASRLAELAGRRQRLEQRDRRLSRIRLAFFLASLPLLGIGYFVAPESWPWVVPGWASFLAFLWAAARQEANGEQIADITARERVNRKAIGRLQRNWDVLGDGAPPVEMTDSPLAEDLDLFGPASLFAFLSLASTEPGKRTLASWMLEPASPAEASERFEVARQWAGCREAREHFHCLSRRIAQGAAPPEEFIRWASGPTLSERAPAFLASIRWLPLLWIPLLIVGVTGVLSPSWFLGAIFAGVTLNVLITIVVGGQVHREFTSAAGRGRIAAQYLMLFELLGQFPGESRMATQIRDMAQEHARPAILRLVSVLRLGLIRHNPLLFLFVYVPLQLVFLWDFQLLPLLERWQRRDGAEANRWFETLGQAEALLSIAALQHDYPEWAEPTWLETGGEAVWRGQAVGHPLLTDSQRVCNDVALGPAGRVLLVTGSNMSGKSTLLRSVGLNTVLAGMGAPVCARSLRLPPLWLATSIRVHDSVRDGVSFFMAELLRLKEVVQAAEQGADGRQVMYLLDEVLQGTNSRERKIAVSRVLKTLTATSALGALSTHDLELAADPEILAVADLVHFREHFQPDAEGKERMTFDYQMHQGVTPTTNALKLLEMMGIVHDK